MKKHIVYGLMALSLCGPAQARPDYSLLPEAQQTVAQNEVVQFILKCVNASNEQEIFQLVKANPDMTRRCFDGMLPELLKKKPEQREARFNGLLWLWARALEDAECSSA